MTEATPKVYKVAVWATGGVGEYAIRTITDRPNLELTGVWVHSDEKKGRDAANSPASTRWACVPPAMKPRSSAGREIAWCTPLRHHTA